MAVSHQFASILLSTCTTTPCQSNGPDFSSGTLCASDRKKRERGRYTIHSPARRWVSFNTSSRFIIVSRETPNGCEKVHYGIVISIAVRVYICGIVGAAAHRSPWLEGFGVKSRASVVVKAGKTIDTDRRAKSMAAKAAADKKKAAEVGGRRRCIAFHPSLKPQPPGFKGGGGASFSP